MANQGKRGSRTIRDVAKYAAVSPMSVSNFINGRTHLMGEPTRKRIENAIAALGYRPNPKGRGFRQGKDYSVGMIVVDPSPNALVEPFIGHVVSGLSTELAAEGYACLLQGLRDCEDDERAIENFARSDALCVFPSGPASKRAQFCERLSSLGIPLVLAEENQATSQDDIAIVRQDDARGAEMLIEHLLPLGPRRFLYVRPAPIWPANSVREAAFRSALKSSDRRCTLKTLTCGFGNFDEVRRSLLEWMDDGGRCDAILANNDHIGIAVLKALSERAIRVPDDVLVTGFGGFELWNYSSPRLTTILSPARKIGEVAARALLDRLESGRFSQERWVLPVELKLSETTMRLRERPPTTVLGPVQPA